MYISCVYSFRIRISKKSSLSLELRVVLIGRFKLSSLSYRIIYCGMEDKSGESALYDRVALRFKGGIIVLIIISNYRSS